MGPGTGPTHSKNADTLVSWGLSQIAPEPGPGPARPAQPPATAGITDTRDPADTGVSSPLVKRTSSSPTYTFTKRRRFPLSSTIRPARPGYDASRLARTSRKVPGSAVTSAEPPVNVRKMVGIRTETLIRGLPFLAAAA